VWEVGEKKEADEGIPFHTLLTTGTHRGDRILRRKLRRLSVLFCAVSVLVVLAWGWHSGGAGGDEAREGAAGLVQEEKGVMAAVLLVVRTAQGRVWVQVI
jgi:hypothetical protein